MECAENFDKRQFRYVNNIPLTDEETRVCSYDVPTKPQKLSEKLKIIALFLKSDEIMQTYRKESQLSDKLNSFCLKSSSLKNHGQIQGCSYDNVPVHRANACILFDHYKTTLTFSLRSKPPFLQ